MSADRGRCVATTGKGTQCPHLAVGGQETCGLHHPWLRLFHGMAQFPNRVEFEAAMAARKGSVEHDFGLRWRLGSGRSSWRMSWIRWTCEVYAEELSGAGRIVVIGVFTEPYDVAETLGDWPVLQGEPGGLEWAVARLRSATCRVG